MKYVVPGLCILFLVMSSYLTFGCSSKYDILVECQACPILLPNFSLPSDAGVL